MICQVCSKAFQASRMGQKVCGYRCAVKVPKIERQVEAKKTRERKERIKPRSDWMKEAQVAFNRFIRIRDEEKPCISCGRMHQGKWNAGHYMSVGARPELRFDEANVHKQCEPCNSWLSGNLVFYRIELQKRIGEAEMIRLEGPLQVKKYTIDDLKQIRDTYRAKAKGIACKADAVSA